MITLTLDEKRRYIIMSIKTANLVMEEGDDEIVEEFIESIYDADEETLDEFIAAGLREGLKAFEANEEEAAKIYCEATVKVMEMEKLEE